MEFLKRLNPNRKAILFLVGSFVLAAFPWAIKEPFLWGAYFLGVMGFSYIWSRILSLQWDRPMVRETDLISSLIILLIVMPPLSGLAGYSFGWVLGVIAVALSWKRFVRWKMSPVFNPAGLALLGFSLMGAPVFYSWWGTAFYGVWGVAWMLVWALLFLRLWRKEWMAWIFILASVVFGVLYCLIHQHMPAQEMFWYMLQNATMYFFASWMLIEPKTSPILVKEQGLVAILAAGFYWFAVHFTWSQALLWTIIFANSLTFILKVYRSKKASLRAPSAPVEGSRQS